MKWQFREAPSEQETPEDYPITCAKCGKLLQPMDIYYYPIFLTDKEAKWLETIFAVDPFGGNYRDGNAAVFCEECVEGHCGLADPKLNAEAWLQKQIREAVR